MSAIIKIAMRSSIGFLTSVIVWYTFYFYIFGKDLMTGHKTTEHVMAHLPFPMISLSSSPILGVGVAVL